MSKHYDPHGDTEYACGGDADCEAVASDPGCVDGLRHRWTARGTGGCNTNPGVWSLGGTAWRFTYRCRVCGCGRTEHAFGYQRNPGQCDEVSCSPGEYAPEPDEIADERRRARRRRRYRLGRPARAICRALRALHAAR